MKNNTNSRRATLLQDDGNETLPPRTRIFLLSPANTAGIKGQRLLSATGECDLARRLRDSGAPLGEIYRFISSLYFRGKLDYAQKFNNPPRGVAGVQIITGAGLMLPETVVLGRPAPDLSYLDRCEEHRLSRAPGRRPAAPATSRGQRH